MCFKSEHCFNLPCCIHISSYGFKMNSEKKMKLSPDKHTILIVLCAFQTGPKPVLVCSTQTPGAVTRSGFLLSCQACTIVLMNSAKSCLEPMLLSAMTWRYSIQLF